MRHNPFDHYSSRNARINILLENFHFFHRPTTSAMDEKVDPKYIGKSNPMHQLYNWIKYNEANSGSYLVTGYRGAGKSSLVGKLMKDLQREENRYVMFPYHQFRAREYRRSGNSVHYRKTPVGLVDERE